MLIYQVLDVCQDGMYTGEGGNDKHGVTFQTAIRSRDLIVLQDIFHDSISQNGLSWEKKMTLRSTDDDTSQGLNF